jgi:peptidoglycan/LPS O-acetylase OafA/YrhL
VWVYRLWDDDLSELAMPFFLNLFLLQTTILPAWNWWWSFNTVSWSISDEMFFYFSFPFIIYFLNRNKNLLIALILLSATVIPLAMFATSATDLRIERFYIQPFFRIADFLIGVLLYEIYLKIKNSNVLKFANSIELFAILLFIGFFAFHKSVPQVYRYSCYYWLPISLIILIFSFQKGCVSQLLSKKYFVYLGEISYSFYMFHALAIQYFLKLNHRYWFFENYYLFVCFLLYFSVFISAISYGAFEKPLNNYIIKRFTSKG